MGLDPMQNPDCINLVTRLFRAVNSKPIRATGEKRTKNA